MKRRAQRRAQRKLEQSNSDNDDDDDDDDNNNNNERTTKTSGRLSWKSLSEKNLFKFKKDFIHSDEGGEGSVRFLTTTIDDTNHSIDFPISRISPIFPIVQYGTPIIISSLISIYNVLPTGTSKYKDEKSKKYVEGFAFMENIRNYELSLLDIIDKDMDLISKIYIKAGIDLKIYDPKTPITESPLFVPSIFQPKCEENNDPNLTGHVDTSKSPIMSIEMCINDDEKVDARTVESIMNIEIPIMDLNTFISTTVRVKNVISDDKIDFKYLTTWEEFEHYCVHYKDPEKCDGTTPFFELIIASEVLAPSLFFNKSEIRFQWKFKFITIFQKNEISHQLGRMPEKYAEKDQAYQSYVKKYLNQKNIYNEITRKIPDRIIKETNFNMVMSYYS
jgi:hypothetical protein